MNESFTECISSYFSEVIKITQTEDGADGFIFV